MATSDGDVTMSDAAGSSALAADSTATSSSISQSTRTDHDRKYYYMPSQPLKRSRPHVSQNLISDYGLDAVHDRVRRLDPNTGEKINKLRKSYVGIVKNLHLAGSNKEVPSPGQWLDTINVHDPQGLLDKGTRESGVEVIDGQNVPQYEDVWKVDVKPVSKQAAQGLLAKLGTAMQMAPGKLEETDKWKKLLGEDYPKKPVVPPVATLKAPGAVSSSAKPSPRLGPTAGRTQRTGAKRNYDEASFAGYDETYDDVERSAADMVRHKKARKVSFKSPLESSPKSSRSKKNNGKKK